MKKLITILAVSLSIFLIYFFNRDTSVYYVALGDKNNNYYEDLTEYLEAKEKLEVAKLQFLSANYGIPEINRQINKNINIENQTIKNALIKADLVTVYFSTYDVIENEGDFSYVDQKAKELDSLLKLLRSYCKESIVLVGPNDDYSGSLKYSNKVFRNVASTYDVFYIIEDSSTDITSDIINKVKLKT